MNLEPSNLSKSQPNKNNNLIIVSTIISTLCVLFYLSQFIFDTSGRQTIQFGSFVALLLVGVAPVFLITSYVIYRMKMKDINLSVIDKTRQKKIYSFSMVLTLLITATFTYLYIVDFKNSGCTSGFCNFEVLGIILYTPMLATAVLYLSAVSVPELFRKNRIIK